MNASLCVLLQYHALQIVQFAIGFLLSYFRRSSIVRWPGKRRGKREMFVVVSDTSLVRSSSVSLLLFGKSGSVSCLEHRGSSWCTDKRSFKILLMIKDSISDGCVTDTCAEFASGEDDDVLENKEEVSMGSRLTAAGTLEVPHYNAIM